METTLKSGVCPKCNSEEVYGEIRDYSKILPSSFGFGAGGTRPNVENYVCGNCGYVEFYVRAEDLERVKRNWIRRRKR